MNFATTSYTVVASYLNYVRLVEDFLAYGLKLFHVLE